jgi:beta-lactamase superfamily II metal-dependent hydrolase
MAGKPRKNRRKKAGKGKFAFPVTLCGLILAVVGFFFLNDNYLRIEGVPTSAQVAQKIGISTSTAVTVADGELAVHYIDIGQGDCELIVSDEMAVLIDCGEEQYASTVLKYINNLGIKSLDYVIVTHPHSDHMGGMYKILSNISVGKLIMPELPDDMIPLTSCYSRMLDAIEEKNISASYAKAGDRFSVGSGAYLEILAPLHDDYTGLNNFSVVTRLVHGSNRFLFTGDIERAAENDILNNGADVSADVIKVAHHGSSSSSTLAFLKAVSAKYAVISVGKDNSYGHPTESTLEDLDKAGCEVYCTMDYGSIVFVSDGEKLTMSTEKGDLSANDSESEAA